MPGYGDLLVSEMATFMFADLSGFTTLTEAVGDERAADLALGFCDRVCELNPGHNAEDVKSIGDACMIRAVDPAMGILLALRIVNDIGEQHGIPAVRIGMNHGPAVARRGDWFGMTVNVAARIGALAGDGEVLLSGAVRAAAGDPEGVVYRDRGEHRLRHVSTPVHLFAAEQHSEVRRGVLA